jgi:hypothetical protein
MTFPPSYSGLARVYCTTNSNGACGNIDGWGIMLQGRRPQAQFPVRSLDFSIDLSLHYGPEVDSASDTNEYQETSGVKGGW